MSVTLLGIRHHGPGSSRHVRACLNKLKPDLILLEAPAEAQDFIQYVGTTDLKPPVALLAYQNDLTSNSVFYPFAVFSPEWQAMLYANKNQVPLRCFDLPLAHTLGVAALNDSFSLSLEHQADLENASKSKEADNVPSLDDVDDPENQEPENIWLDWDKSERGDPFDALAKACNLEDGEAFWESKIELRRDSSDIFDCVKELVTALRENSEQEQGFSSKRDLIREAWMRKKVREAEKEGYQNIVVVCGAWHVPAIEQYKKIKVKDDNALLKSLPKVKVSLTWIPWTYSRLSYASGYGAGIVSPKWYEFLFYNPEDNGVRWLTKVAEVLRKAKYDISVAHVMEAVRLAHALCAMRNLSSPTLAEYKEAITSVMGFGSDIIFKIVNEKLVIGSKIGSVPTSLPKVALLADFEKIQKKLRLSFSTEEKEIVLDLRKPLDLARSVFFHRLDLIDFKWAKETYIDGLGSFKEKWILKYKPENILSLIDKSIYGSTLEKAIYNYVSLSILKEETSLTALSAFLNKLVSCDMPALLDKLSDRIDDLCAVNPDPIIFIKMISDLVPIVRYGDVRKLDFSKFKLMISDLLERILATGLVSVINIDDKAASQIRPAFDLATTSIKTLNSKHDFDLWFSFLSIIQSTSKVHPLLSGSATRLLFSLDPSLDRNLIARAISFYTSAGNKPLDMASWLEGFLYESGRLLYLDDELWLIVHSFICSLDENEFIEILPILRRSFSSFDSQELLDLGTKAQNYDENTTKLKIDSDSKLINSLSNVNIPESSFDSEKVNKFVQGLFSVFGCAFGAKEVFQSSKPELDEKSK